MKPFKMHTEGGKWIIQHGTHTAKYDNAKEAYMYISFFMIFRKHRRTAAEPYPVRSLVPHPKRGCANA